MIIANNILGDACMSSSIKLFLFLRVETIKRSKLKMSNPPTMPRIVTRLAYKHGLKNENSIQTLKNDISIYSSSFFAPLHYSDRFNENPRKFLSQDSYCIHYWHHGWSWLSSKSILRHISNQPWLFMNVQDWKRFLKILIQKILNKSS